MKVTPQWFVLCEQVLRDAGTQQLTLVNCLEQVSATSFPAHHPRFAFAAQFTCDAPPEHDRKVTYRFVRRGEEGEEEQVAEIQGVWPTTTRIARVYLNFHILRLRRPETLAFRLDYQVDRGRWHRGPTAELVSQHLPLPPEARAELEARIKALE